MRRLNTLGILLAAACLTLPGQHRADAEDLQIIRAKTLHTGTGEVLTPGSVLVKDGQITEVGATVEADGAAVIEVDTLIPGLIDAAARTGVRQLDDERTKEVTPDMATAAIVDWQDRGFKEQVAAGTTSLHLTPGTSNVIAGIAAAVKTAGPAADRVISDRTGLTLSMCQDPASGNGSRSRPDSIYIRQPTNRMGVVWILRNAFQATRAGTMDSIAMREAADGKLPLFAVSRTQYDINSLMTLADEFSLQPILIGGQESWKVTDKLAERRMPVILQRNTPGSTRGSERTRVSGDMAARLQAADIPFCLSGGDLLEQIRFAVRYGLEEQAALAAITSSPAAILGIDDRVGTIQAGRDADFVALDGPPLEFTTAITWVMVDGVIQFEQAGN